MINGFKIVKESDLINVRSGIRAVGVEKSSGIDKRMAYVYFGLGGD